MRNYWNVFSATFNANPVDDKCRHGRSRAFTLLEMLIVLVLIVVLLGGLASLVRLFSNSYTMDERRVGKAQLARSISQMLSDDLSSAVQDPIQAVADDPDRQFIRHFGLRGDSRSLQIDVVQPNLFVSTATAEENQRVLSGGDKSSNSRQVPELKTIFYEFVPINATEKQESENAENNNATDDNSGEDLGSTLSGALTTNSSDDSFGQLSSNGYSQEGTFLDGSLPLVQKFGLSRRELDYETPEGDDSDEQSARLNEAATSFNSDVQAESVLAGSLTSTPDSANSTLASSSLQADPNLVLGNNVNLEFKTPMTAEQIAMDSDDGTVWAPEVLDCRFSYFDGSEWLDSWDSIEKNGLPVAIKVELKLAPLDDVDLYRQSEMLLLLPIVPSVESISNLSKEQGTADELDATDTSRLTGSLTQVAAENGVPVDVFNTYRPIEIMRAAIRGIPLKKSASSASDAIAEASAITQATEENDAATNLSNDNVNIGGSLNGTTSGTSDINGSLTLNITNDSMQSAIQNVQDMIANGAVFNDEGICVDYSNDGSYVTLEQIAAEIGIAQPTVYEVVTYLPTTPLSRATSIERRRPTVVQSGRVSTRRNNVNNDNSSRSRRERGENPFATGRARQYQERTRSERTVADRSAVERNRSDRQVENRGSANRLAADRGPAQSRGATARNVQERTAVSSRGGNDRQFNERRGANGGWSDSLNVANDDLNIQSDSGSSLGGNAVPVEPDPLEQSSDALLSNQEGSVIGGSAGGMTETGAADSVGDVNPFAIIDQQTGEVPFAGVDSGFYQLDVNSVPGLIETPAGENSVASPTRNGRASKQQSTWIRGK